MKTIFVDIDGTIFKQKRNLSDIFEEDLELLPGVKEAFDNWNWKGYKIIITTGRKESTRLETERSLRSANLFWDHLLMGLDVGGQRIIINDTPDPDRSTAIAYSITRDKGFSENICEL
jgi:phosphoglycolate phosphatase-like HAD superfamily hydrolase|tara:strand:+ start:5777 stop:6130 length:354 start_codon:yes stop_codon:yes gene_type:complete